MAVGGAVNEECLFFVSNHVLKVGDLCWSSERDSSMQALMRELFYFNYQSVPVAENSYMSTSGFLIAGDNVQAASILLSRLLIMPLIMLVTCNAGK